MAELASSLSDESRTYLKLVKRQAGAQDFLEEIMCAFSRLTDAGLCELKVEFPAEIAGRSMVLKLSLKKSPKLTDRAN